MPPQAEVYGPRAPQNSPEAGFPSISYNAPVLKRFSGKAGEYQTITDFIEAIERQALLECRGDEAAKVKLSMSLFRMNLKGDARAYLGMLTSTEKESWEKLKEVYIYKFKTERDLKAKQRAKEQCASFKQRPEESLKAYGERAMRLRQLIDLSEEAFLVYRFLKGVRDKSVRQILAIGPEDLGKMTVAQMNSRIGNLIRAGEESDASEADSNSSSDDSSDDSDVDDSYKRKKNKKAKKTVEGKALKRAMKVIGGLEEKLKQAESNGSADTFAAQAVYNNNGANYKRAPGVAENGGRSSSTEQFNSGSGQHGGPPEGYVCYNCGTPGHLYRFCPEPKGNQGNGGRPGNYQNNQRQGWGSRRPIIFPGENGPQSMVWVDNPPNGLAPGYFSVDMGNTPRREGTPAENANRGNRSQQDTSRNSPRITELNNTTSVDLVSSAARKMTIGTDVVRYVNAVEEAYAGGRRRRADDDAGSSEAPTRTRIRLGEPVGSDPVRGEASSTPAMPTAVPPVAPRPPPQVLQDSDGDEPLPPPQVEQVRKRRAAVPKPPRHIRMMIERPGFDVVAEFRDLPVANMKWGMLMDIAPALRRQVGTGLLLERQAKRAKGKGVAQAEPMEIAGVNKATRDKGKEPCTNFYTTATLTVNRKRFKIEKVMIDAGSVVNLASIGVLETLGVGLFPVHNLTIRTATSALTEIQYYSDIEIEVAGVKTLIRVYAIPREFFLAYGMLLSRRWLQKVRAQGNYERDTYVIADEHGCFRAVERYKEHETNAAEIPTVGRRDDSSTDDASDLEDEAVEELEIAETSEGEDEDVLRDVIGQATEEMWKHDYSESAGDADSESSGNGEGR